MVSNEELMRQALDIARSALASNDVPIGALVLNSNGEVISTGANRREVDNDPSAHAEVVAMREAGRKLNNWRLDGCTVVVTLEPCAMCAGAISQSRVKTLIFGAWDEKAGAVGSIWDVLRDPRSPHRTEVISGILEKECADILAQFFKTQRDQ
jgi:tRNA(adenine34) deaminase